MINPQGIATARSYYFDFSDDRPSIEAKDNTGYMQVFLREPGLKIIRMRSEVTGSGFRGESYYQDLDIELPYEPGRLVIADFAFVQEYAEIGRTTVSADVRFRPIPASERDELRTEFLERPEAAMWVD